METIQMSVNRWLDKQNVVYTYNGISVTLKKECNSDTRYNMEEPGGHCAKWSKSDAKGHMLYDSTFMSYLD